MWRWSLGWRGRLPQRAHCRVSSPFWPIRLSSWNQISSRLPRSLVADGGGDQLGQFFLNSACASGSDLRVLRPGRDPAEAERPDELAHAALLVADAEAAARPGRRDRPDASVPPRPAPTRGRSPGSAPARRCCSGLSRRCRPGALRSTRPIGAGCVEAVHPVAQGLPVHAGAARRILAARALQHQRDRQAAAAPGPASPPPWPAPVARPPSDPSAPPPSSAPPPPARRSTACLNKTGKSQTS